MSNPKLITNLRKLPFRPWEVTLVGGYYDLLHAGHVAFLQKCRSLGNPLFVFVLSDELCSQKGERRPVIGQKDRAYLLGALTCVDWVYILRQSPEIFSEKLYRLVKPRVVVFSGERNFSKLKEAEMETVRKTDPQIEVRIIERQRSDLSTTQIIEKLSGKKNNKSYGILNSETEIKEMLERLAEKSNGLESCASMVINEGTGEVLAVGYNYHPRVSGRVVHQNKRSLEYRQNLPRPTHAEISAIFNYLNRYYCLPNDNLVLYTTTAPCAGCAEVIRLSGIKKVRYFKDFYNNYGVLLLKGKIDIRKIR